MIDLRLRAATVYPWRRARALRIRGPAIEFPAIPDTAPTAHVAAALARWSRRHPHSAAVFADDARVVALVDRARSFPLFSARTGGELRLGDEARALLDDADHLEADDEARTEALLCGFVSGTRTLSRRLRQLPAGTVTSFEKRDHEWRRSELECLGVTPRSADASASRPDRLDELEGTYRDLGERLFAELAGRPLLLPLTGGTDSRCLALMARACGYDRVLCYGNYEPGHWETQVARAVAARLGFPFLHVAWGRDAWRKRLPLAARSDFFRHADGLSSLPSLVEWPGAAELRRHADVPADAVIVSGHFGDVITGGVEEPASTASRRAVATDIWRTRYCLNHPPSPRFENERRAQLRIAETLGQIEARPAFSGDDDTGYPGLRHRWEWTEYQAKQVGIAARTFEHHGFEWRFPLVDPAFLAFWAGATPGERSGRSLHRAFVRRANERWHLPPANPGQRGPTRLRRLARRFAHRVGLASALRSARTARRRRRGPDLSRSDGIGWSALYLPGEIRGTYTGLEGVPSYLAREWIAEATRTVQTAR